MKELSEVEKLFVMEVLDTHGEYVTKLLHDRIIELDESRDNSMILSGELLKSIEYSVRQDGGDYILSISFLSYGRAVEISFFKSKLRRRETKWARNEIRKLRRKNHKDTRFYAKNVYGSINRLLSRMGSEYTDSEINRLKEILEQRIISSK